jgi:hypothetical protein
MIATLVSQRLEDRNREKKKKKVAFAPEERTAETTSENTKIKTGPPSKQTKKADETEASDREEDRRLSTEKTKDLHLRGKALPYVDVPPLKASLRNPAYESVKEDQTAKIGPAYKSRAPVELGVDIEKLVEHVLDLEINVPLRSLAGVSGAIQKEIRKQVTKARMPVATTEEKQVNLLTENEKPIFEVMNMKVASYMVSMEISDGVPEGHLVANDPVLQFLLETGNTDPGRLIVAKPSESLRAIYMTINRVGQEECLLDDGSQIVSMAKETGVKLGLTWDPSLSIDMESASKHVERTLGLAKNVRFRVGGLDIFLQVHVLENPPYKVLLGRPFSVFTACINKTNLDGTSELVLTDPNTKGVAIVPTYERGVGPEELLKQNLQGF